MDVQGFVRMKYIFMYIALLYIVACADDVTDHGDTHSTRERIVRAILWPKTVTSWFRTQNIRLHRMLNILWCVLIAGWFFSLMADRL
jgi:hypothetical protein